MSIGVKEMERNFDFTTSIPGGSFSFFFFLRATFRPREARQGAMHLRAAGSRSYPWYARWVIRAESCMQKRASERTNASARQYIEPIGDRCSCKTRGAAPRTSAASCILGRIRLHSACINPGDRPREKRRVQCPIPREHAPPRRAAMRTAAARSLSVRSRLCEFLSALLFSVLHRRFSLSFFLFFLFF